MRELSSPKRLRVCAIVMLAALAGCQSMMPPAPSDGASLSATGQIAAIRASNGLSPLVADTKLEDAAKQQAGYMARADRMTHTTGMGRDFASRMGKNDVEGAAAENVAHGRMSMDKVFDMWMHSAPHRRNMLDPRFTKYGLASADAGKDGERYWALVLGR